MLAWLSDGADQGRGVGGGATDCGMLASNRSEGEDKDSWDKNSCSSLYTNFIRIIKAHYCGNKRGSFPAVAAATSGLATIAFTHDSARLLFQQPCGLQGCFRVS